jgi:hypothetical protein
MSADKEITTGEEKNGSNRNALLKAAGEDRMADRRSVLRS